MVGQEERVRVRHQVIEGPEGTTRVPDDAEAWELYSDMRGAGLAAARLTKALIKAINAPKRKEAIEIMSRALSVDSKYGAADTEPRAHAEHCLTEARGGDYHWEL